MLHLVELVAAFAPGPAVRPSVVRRSASAPPQMLDVAPLASTMQLAVDAPAPSPVGYFDGAPLEVIFLFVWIFGAGAVFLVKSSGLNVRATAAQLLSQVAGPSVASELGAPARKQGGGGYNDKANPARPAEIKGGDYSGGGVTTNSAVMGPSV